MAAAITTGVTAKPFVASMIIGGGLMTTGYVFVRLPTLYSLLRHHGPKVLLAIVYAFIFNLALSSAFYGLGTLFAA